MGEVRQKIRGTTTELDGVLGLVGLLAYDETTNNLRIYNGVTLGGFPILTKANTLTLLAASGSVSYDSSRLGGQLPAFYATSARTITAGNGMTGGGDLTANRTLTLGTPGSVTTTSTNAAAAGTHTHALTLTAANLNTIYTFTPANSANSVVAGNGMTGGGTLAASRTLTLGTPGTITDSTTNSVTTTSHTHALDLTIADIGAASVAISIVAGDGLNGGGTLAASRTLTLGGPSTVSGSSTNVVSSGSHSHALSLSAANIIDYLNYTPVSTATNIVAGNGMTGGGALSASRTITLGTPGTLTNSTANSVSSTSHTHALGFTAAEVYTGSDSDEDTFPIGHTVVVYTDGAVYNRNAVIVVKMRSTDNNVYVSDDVAGANQSIAGTWRARGLAGNQDFYMAQRTA